MAVSRLVSKSRNQTRSKAIFTDQIFINKIWSINHLINRKSPNIGLVVAKIFLVQWSEPKLRKVNVVRKKNIFSKSDPLYFLSVITYLFENKSTKKWYIVCVSSFSNYINFSKKSGQRTLIVVPLLFLWPSIFHLTVNLDLNYLNKVSLIDITHA